jgi:hypothetical protein
LLLLSADALRVGTQIDRKIALYAAAANALTGLNLVIDDGKDFVTSVLTY